MIFIDAVEIDECLASHLVGPNPLPRDQLIGFRFAEFSIAAAVLELDKSAPIVAVGFCHGLRGLEWSLPWWD